jgi:hypothetical protein
MNQFVEHLTCKNQQRCIYPHLSTLTVKAAYKGNKIMFPFTKKSDYLGRGKQQLATATGTQEIEHVLSMWLYFSAKLMSSKHTDAAGGKALDTAEPRNEKRNN